MVRNLLQEGAKTLAELPAGGTAVIRGLGDDFAPFERQRLLDLGAVPGTSVTVAGAAALGGLRAYKLRGTLLGLRKGQAERILVEQVN